MVPQLCLGGTGTVQSEFTKHTSTNKALFVLAFNSTIAGTVFDLFNFGIYSYNYFDFIRECLNIPSIGEISFCLKLS